MEKTKLFPAAVDPVCGSAVNDPHALACVYHRRTYQFCCLSCRSRFLRGPEDFVKGPREPGDGPLIDPLIDP